MREFWLQALLNSLMVVGGVTILSLLFALPAAWAIERSDLPGRRFFNRVLSLPYVIPSYLLAMSWITLANPTVGWINLVAKESGWQNGALLNIYNLGGIIFIEASALFAILFLSFQSGLKKMDASLEEAARLAGAGALRIFFTITCPLLRNTIFSALIAIALASLASFGVPAMIGGPARIFVLTTGIFSLLKQGSLAAQNEALGIALEMGLAAIALVFVSRLFSKKQFSLVSGKSSRPALVPLGWARFPLASFFALFWLTICGLPMITLIIASFQTNPGSLHLTDFSVKAWEYVLFTLPDFRSSVVNSLLLSVVAALVIIIVAIPVSLWAWKAHYHRSRRHVWLSRIFEDSAMLIYSLPGTVVAVLLIFLATRFSALNISDTLFILAIAYVLKYLTLGFRTLGPATFLVHPSLIEAAQLSGAGVWTRLRLIWVPLLRPALVATAILILMPCLAELTMSVLLYGPGTETLGVTLFQLQEYADRASAAVVGSLLLGSVILFQLIAGKVLRER